MAFVSLCLVSPSIMPSRSIHDVTVSRMGFMPACVFNTQAQPGQLLSQLRVLLCRCHAVLLGLTICSSFSKTKP